jgi:hypothetical protein
MAGLIFLEFVYGKALPEQAGSFSAAPSTDKVRFFQTYNDTPDDVFKGLQMQGFYVSPEASTKINEADLEQRLSQTVKKLKDKKHDTRIAVITERVLMAAPASEGGDSYKYAEYLRKTLKPAPQVVIMLTLLNNGDNRLALAEDKLDVESNSALVQDGLNLVGNADYGRGLELLAQRTANRIEDKGSEWIGTVLLIVGIIVAIIVLVVLVLAFPVLGEVLGAIFCSSST